MNDSFDCNRSAEIFAAAAVASAQTAGRSGARASGQAAPTGRPGLRGCAIRPR